MKNEMKIATWIELLQSKGKLSFSVDKLRVDLIDYTPVAIKRSLQRLSEKGKIKSIYKGYYIIIPPQYSVMRILPPALFIDNLMKYLKRDYYVGLLTAAAYHGAAHQQPQEFFVVTDYPRIKSTIKNGVKLNYLSINKLPTELIEKKKTETGYINISNPALTAADLIQYEDKTGGINRAATIISELGDELRPEHFCKNLISHVQGRTLQRLGYILEYACENRELSDALFLQVGENKMYRIPLKPSKEVKGFSSKNRWNIIENLKIEIDE